MNFDNLEREDEQIAHLVQKEKERQENSIELIASENFVSKAVMEAMGSYLTNKYAEGYPSKRYYGGCHVVDEVEDLARERVKNYLGLSMLMYNHIQDHKLIWLFIFQY